MSTAADDILSLIVNAVSKEVIYRLALRLDELETRITELEDPDNLKNAIGDLALHETIDFDCASNKDVINEHIEDYFRNSSNLRYDIQQLMKKLLSDASVEITV